MERTDEWILCSAVMYNGMLIAGMRHSDCYRVITGLTGITKLPGRESQGFLTSNNRFVDRAEAWKIAKNNGQIRYGAVRHDEDIELISENLY